MKVVLAPKADPEAFFRYTSCIRAPFTVFVVVAFVVVAFVAVGLRLLTILLCTYRSVVFSLRWILSVSSPRLVAVRLGLRPLIGFAFVGLAFVRLRLRLLFCGRWLFLLILFLLFRFFAVLIRFLGYPCQRFPGKDGSAVASMLV